MTKGGLKRHKAPVKMEPTNKRPRKTEEEAHSPTPSSMSGDSSEDDLPNVMPVYKEPSMYNNLLTALGSGNEAFANVYTRRQREEEGRSDSEDEDGAPESPSVSENDDDGDEGTDLEEPNQADIMVPSDDAESENENEASDIDDGESESMNVIGHTGINSLKGTSSFSDHVGHILTQAEVDDLLKRKWKYKWEVPAVDMPMSKWVGTGHCFLKEINECADYGLKLKLYKHWFELFKSSGGEDFHSSRRRRFFSMCNSYVDILHCNKRPFYLKGLEEDSSIMEAYIMHALNHVFKTRDLVTGNEAKLAKLCEHNKEVSHDGFLDHGYTRPKVLILLPLASIAFRVVKRLVQLTPVTHRVNVEYLDRFSDQFGAEDINSNDEKHELSSNGLNDGNSKPQKSSKPSDHQTLFGGNNNDLFMIGIKFTRRSIKLYSDFYSSDIILASPLGLKMKIEAAEVDKDKDVDYLSSIEVLIIDHADVISKQNWEHVNYIIEHLNHIPSKQHGTDVMRIRKWYLNGHAQFYRQTILLSSFLNPDMNSSFNQRCLNYQGKVKSVTEYKGVLPKVLLQVRQVYERFDVASIVDADDSRLEYFTQKVFPKIKDSVEGGTMIFVNTHLEYVPIRNFLQKTPNSSYCLLGDYTDQKNISRARVYFFEGKAKMMLYTERAHFYHRYKIRGIKNLIIYSLPDRKDFYTEILNMIEESEDMTCTVLFSRYDKLRLERIIGTPHAKRLISSDKNMFVFC